MSFTTVIGNLGNRGTLTVDTASSTTIISAADIPGATGLREQGSIIYDPDDSDSSRRYKCFVTAEPTNTIYVVHSSDGTTWGTPVATNLTSKQDPSIVTYMDNPTTAVRVAGALRVYYERTDAAVGTATSTDGVTWSSNTDAITWGSTGEWDASLVGSPIARFDGTNYIIGYEGIAATALEAFGIAYGTNPTSLTKSANNPLWHPDDDAAISTSIVVDSIYKSGSRVYFLAHSGLANGDTVFRGSTANLDPLTWERGDIAIESELGGFRNDITLDHTHLLTRIVTAPDDDQTIRSYPLTGRGAWYGPTIKRKVSGTFDTFARAAKVAGSFPSYAAAVIADAPVAYYRCNETSGTTLTDAMGTYDGTIVGPTMPGSGRIGGGITFDGVDDYATVTTLGTLGSSRTLTIEFWIRSSDTDSDYILGTVNTGSSAICQVRANTDEADTAAAGKTCVFIRSASGQSSGRLLCSMVTSIYDGAWHHVAIVASLSVGVNPTCAIYVDGVSQTVTYGARNIFTALGDWGWPMALGAQNYRGVMTSPIAADLDEVAFYNTALSAERVALHAVLR